MVTSVKRSNYLKQIGLILAACLSLCGTVFAGKLETFEMMVPVQIDGELENMDTRVYKLVDEPAQPLLILTHGTPAANEQRRAMKSDIFQYIAEDFAYEGYVVVVAMRGGFAKTSFEYREDVKIGNGRNDVYLGNLEAAQQLKDVIEYYKTQKYVDKTKIYAAGASTGGHSVVALSTLNVEGLRGVVNFSGGRGANKPQLFDSMVTAMAKAGAKSRVPNLWLYAVNDTFFPPDLAEGMSDAFKAMGGKLQYEMLPPIGTEGHSLIYFKSVWRKMVIDFLRLS